MKKKNFAILQKKLMQKQNSTYNHSFNRSSNNLNLVKLQIIQKDQILKINSRCEIHVFKQDFVKLKYFN